MGTDKSVSDQKTRRRVEGFGFCVSTRLERPRRLLRQARQCKAQTTVRAKALHLQHPQ